MRNFFENRMFCAVVAWLFAAGFAFNAHQGTVAMRPSSLWSAVDLELVAHGPTLPPEPWQGEARQIAHGPTLPPEPWQGEARLVAHGPTLPPEPWQGEARLVAHGPTLPPEPWQGEATA